MTGRIQHLHGMERPQPCRPLVQGRFLRRSALLLAWCGTLTTASSILLVSHLPAQSPVGPTGTRVGLSPAGQSYIESRVIMPQVAPVDKQGTHWLRGGLIGGAVMGTAMYLLIDSLTRDSDGVGRFRVFLSGIPIGFGIGALIGGQFKK